MKYLLGAGLLLVFSCSSPKKETPNIPEAAVPAPVQKDTFRVSALVTTVTCNNDPSLSYALYLPRQYSDSAKLPVLIFFDPHGDGSYPLSKYNRLAEKFGVIMIGSNDSRNGVTFDQTNLIVQSLVNEALQRFHPDGRLVSLAGFSGGAKVTLVAAAQINSLLSIVYCSAGLPQIPAQLPPALGITGLKDMNYTEVVNTDRQFEDDKVSHALVEWNGKHEWCDTSTFENAFYWMNFRAMEKKIISVDTKLVTEFTRHNSHVLSNPLQEEMRFQKLVSFLNGTADVSEYQSKLSQLRKSKSFSAALDKQQHDLATESRMKENYIQCMDLNDLNWWHEETNKLKNSKSTPSNDRILGYISLACYSYSNKALKQHDLARAERYLGIYYFVDRENPDRAFMQACLYALQGNKAGMYQSLKEAVNYGFTDKPKLMSEKSFSSYRNSDEFRNLLREMK